MATPRIAVSQAQYVRDVDAALSRTLDHMKQAASRGIDIIVFPEWFMGLNPVEVVPNRFTERISQAARDLGLMVVAGSLRTLDAKTGKKQQCSLVLERDGTVAGLQAKLLFYPTERPWFEPGTGLAAISTGWGRIVILPGLDALDRDIWRETTILHPQLVVMATSAKNQSERHALQELAVSRSVDLAATVVLASLLGRFSGTHYVGGALIAHRGRVLTAAGDDELVLMTSDPEAPLIQLGVTDCSSSLPAQSPPPWAPNPLVPQQVIGPEAERRVLLDWSALCAPDPLAAGHHIRREVENNPRWRGLAPAKPGAARELQILLEHQMAGAFCYPGLERTFPWSDAVRELGRILARFSRPLVVHSGPGPAPLRYDAPHLWDDFLLEFPTVPVIFLHMGRCPPYVDEALMMAERHAQVWLETSTAPVGAIKEALAAAGPDRVVFGSGGLPLDFAREWDKLKSLEPELSPTAFQQIVNDNARRLFFNRADLAHPGRNTFHIIK